jgi:predicted porin
MNKNIKLAVAGAVLALSATAANAGIIIPAGDWTLDISGNVNSYTNWTRQSGSNGVFGGLVGNATETRTANSMSTGLLPNFLSVAGSTRQNDLDVTFLISLNPGSFSPNAASGGSGTEHRQAFLTFGDKSWGTVKVGKDLGIYASDAILNDMTLLGVGSASGGLDARTDTTTLGRIGTGFQYADWKTQIAYTTPNFSGFQATVGITQAWNHQASTTTQSMASTAARAGAGTAYEGKASYSFSANDVTGKIWVSGIAQQMKQAATNDRDTWSADIGANVNVAGLGLTGYYYAGEGTGTTFMFNNGYSTAGKKRDSDGGYVQATYVLPTKTKVGVSWGRSNLDLASGDTATTLVRENEMWTLGAYHPLTKHLNLVTEYNNVESKSHSNLEGKSRAVSLGAILFF